MVERIGSNQDDLMPGRFGARTAPVPPSRAGWVLVASIAAMLAAFGTFASWNGQQNQEDVARVMCQRDYDRGLTPDVATCVAEYRG